MGVLIEWYHLYLKQIDNNNQQIIEGIDMLLYLFLGCFIIIIHRLFVLIWSVFIQKEKSLKDIILIITDTYIFREVYHGHINQKPTGFIMFYGFFFCFFVCVFVYVCLYVCLHERALFFFEIMRLCAI